MANKPLKFIEHEINDNIVLTNKKPDKFNKETILIGASKVTVGVSDSSKEVIKTDPITGLKYLENQVDAQQIFNLSKQRRGKYFYLALETGRGGNSWYPGSKKIADTIGENIEIKESPNDSSATLLTLTSSVIVTVTDEGIDEEGLGVIWDAVKYDTVEGFIKSAYLKNKRYVDREV